MHLSSKGPTLGMFKKNLQMLITTGMVYASRMEMSQYLWSQQMELFLGFVNIFVYIYFSFCNIEVFALQINDFVLAVN